MALNILRRRRSRFHRPIRGNGKAPKNRLAALFRPVAVFIRMISGKRPPRQHFMLAG